jgi:DNA ligase-1
MEVLPKLYKLSKTGSVQEWEIKVIERDNGTVNIVTSHGQKDGKLQIEQREVVGKNAGRSNETSAFQQGTKEARKKWLDKKKSGYREDHKEVNKITVLPMLAKRYDESFHKINVPYAIQPKLDGMRALVFTQNGSGSGSGVKIISRLGNSIDTVPHINAEIEKLGILNNGSYYLDGELYTTEYPFEDLVGLLKSETINEDKAEKLRHVKFYAFDLFDLKRPKLTFIERFKILQGLFNKNPSTMVLVETKIGKVLSDDIANKVRDRYLKRGYEGVMFRNLKSVYAINKRSSDLIKHKKTLDSEFEIVNFEEGKGRDIGTPIFILKTMKGDQFKARPTGTIESRRKMFEQANKLIGLLATVEYQELSQKGVPRFPVLVRIRKTME